MNERIEKIKPYFIEMQVVNVEGENVMYTNVKFPNKWVIPDDIENLYKTDTIEKKDGSVVFFIPLSYGDKNLFDCIDYVIKKNLDAEERLKLFNEKVRELENIFRDENNNLKSLSELTFSFKQKKTKTKNEKIITSDENIERMYSNVDNFSKINDEEEDESCQQD